MIPKQRDEGLRRIGRVTRWTAAGGIVLAGALSAVVAKAAPGRSSNPTSGSSPSVAPTPPTGNSSTIQPPTPDNTDQGSGLSPPVVAPSYTGRTGRVSSGGS